MAGIRIHCGCREKCALSKQKSIAKQFKMDFCAIVIMKVLNSYDSTNSEVFMKYPPYNVGCQGLRKQSADISEQGGFFYGFEEH